MADRVRRVSASSDKCPDNSCIDDDIEAVLYRFDSISSRDVIEELTTRFDKGSLKHARISIFNQAVEKVKQCIHDLTREAAEDKDAHETFTHESTEIASMHMDQWKLTSRRKKKFFASDLLDLFKFVQGAVEHFPKACVRKTSYKKPGLGKNKKQIIESLTPIEEFEEQLRSDNSCKESQAAPVSPELNDSILDRVNSEPGNDDTQSLSGNDDVSSESEGETAEPDKTDTPAANDRESQPPIPAATEKKDAETQFSVHLVSVGTQTDNEPQKEAASLCISSQLPTGIVTDPCEESVSRNRTVPEPDPTTMLSKQVHKDDKTITVKRAEYERRVKYMDKVIEDYDKRMNEFDARLSNNDKRTGDLESTIMVKLDEINNSQKEGVREMGKLFYGLSDLNLHLNSNTRDMHVLGSAVYSRMHPLQQNAQNLYQPNWEYNTDSNGDSTAFREPEPRRVNVTGGPSNSPGFWETAPPLSTDREFNEGTMRERPEGNQPSQGPRYPNTNNDARPGYPTQMNGHPYPMNPKRNNPPQKESMREKAVRLTTGNQHAKPDQYVVNPNEPQTQRVDLTTPVMNDQSKNDKGNPKPSALRPRYMEPLIEEGVAPRERNPQNQNEPEGANKSWVDELSDDEFASIVETVEENNKGATCGIAETVPHKMNLNIPINEKPALIQTSTPAEKGSAPALARRAPQPRPNPSKNNNATGINKQAPKQTTRQTNNNANKRNDNGDEGSPSYASMASKNRWLPAPGKRKRVISGNRAMPLRSAKSLSLRELYVEGLAYSGCDSFEDIEQSVYQYCTERDVKLILAKTIPIKLNPTQVGCKITCNVLDADFLLNEEFWPEDIFIRPWKVNIKPNKKYEDEPSDRDDV